MQAKKIEQGLVGVIFWRGDGQGEHLAVVAGENGIGSRQETEGLITDG